MALLTAEQFADKLNISRSRVYALIAAGRVQAVKPGRDWLIDEREAEKPSVRERKTGYPKGRKRLFRRGPAE